MPRRSWIPLATAVLLAGCGAAESPDDRAAAEWAIGQGGVVDLVDRDVKVTVLAKLPEEPFRVEGIDLNRRKIDRAGLAKLAPLEELRYLWLYDAGLQDADLEHLARIESLEELEISFNDISDAGLQRLAPLANLKTLYVRKTDVTADGAERLRQQRGGLTVHIQ
ncbi:MAG: hypothetical protein WD069_14140 [Planctomycetales bacterium]